MWTTTIWLHRCENVMARHSATDLAASRDYPKIWGEFLSWIAMRPQAISIWSCCAGQPGSFAWVVPESSTPFRANRNPLICADCRKHCSVTAGTLFDKTRTPLKNGLLPYGHQSRALCWRARTTTCLGLGSCQTAWMMLHRLRRAMIRSGRERLTEIVEVNETHVGGKDIVRGHKKAQFRPRIFAYLKMPSGHPHADGTAKHITAATVSRPLYEAVFSVATPGMNPRLPPWNIHSDP